MTWLHWRLPFGRESRLPPQSQEVRWRSRALRKRMAFALYLPSGHHGQRETRYPVLYQMHGSGHDRHSVLSDAWQGLLDFCPNELIIRQGDLTHVHLASTPTEAVPALTRSLRAANP